MAEGGSFLGQRLECREVMVPSKACSCFPGPVAFPQRKRSSFQLESCAASFAFLCLGRSTARCTCDCFPQRAPHRCSCTDDPRSSRPRVIHEGSLLSFPLLSSATSSRSFASTSYTSMPWTASVVSGRRSFGGANAEIEVRPSPSSPRRTQLTTHTSPATQQPLDPSPNPLDEPRFRLRLIQEEAQEERPRRDPSQRPQALLLDDLLLPSQRRRNQARRRQFLQTEPQEDSRRRSLPLCERWVRKAQGVRGRQEGWK